MNTVLFALFVVCVPASFVASQETLRTRMEAEFEPWIETLVAQDELIGFAICAVQDGRVAYIHTAGVANNETGEPVTPRSLFHMASVTKPFVATAVMQLVETGRIDLDAPVTAYLPYFTLADDRYREITVRQMLTHTAGMPDVINYEWHKPEFDDGALERFVRSLSDKSLLWAPGTERRYSNIGFDTLGDVVAKASGITFEDYVHSHILAPLGMNDSTLLHKAADPALLTSPHVGKDDPAPWTFFPYNRRHAPSSTLLSSAHDMARWIAANLNRGELDGVRILKASSYDTLWGPFAEQGSGMGLSWFLGEFKGHRTVEHGGSDTGYKSHITLFPDDGLGIAIMANYHLAPNNTIREAALNVALGYDIESD